MSRSPPHNTQHNHHKKTPWHRNYHCSSKKMYKES